MKSYNKENEEKIVKLNTAIILNGMKRITEEAATIREALNRLEHGFRHELDNDNVMDLVKTTAITARTLSTLVDNLTEKLTIEKPESNTTGTNHVNPSTYNTGNAK